MRVSKGIAPMIGGTARIGRDALPLAIMEETALDRFLVELKTLEPHQARVMRQAWDDGDQITRRQAWRVATAALERTGRSGELDKLRAKVTTWANDTTAFAGVQYGGTREKDRVEARVAALPPVMDAGLAAIAGGLLDQDQRYELTKPWRSAIAGQWSRPMARSTLRRSARSTPPEPQPPTPPEPTER